MASAPFSSNAIGIPNLAARGGAAARAGGKTWHAARRPHGHAMSGAPVWPAPSRDRSTFNCGHQTGSARTATAGGYLRQPRIFTVGRPGPERSSRPSWVIPSVNGSIRRVMAATMFSRWKRTAFDISDNAEVTEGLVASSFLTLIRHRLHPCSGHRARSGAVHRVLPDKGGT